MFVAYTVALDLVRSLRPIIPAIKRYDRNLADQLHRAATSVALNIAEGQRVSAGNMRLRFETAQGSASEVRAGLDLAEAWGWLAETSEPRRHLDHVLRLLWGMTHPRGAAR